MSAMNPAPTRTTPVLPILSNLYNADVRMPTRCARTSGPPRCSNPGRRHCTRPARAISPHNAAEPLLTSMAGTPEEGRNSEWRDPHDSDARVAERLLS